MGGVRYNFHRFLTQKLVVFIDLHYAYVLMAGEVPIQLCGLFKFGYELQLDEFFSRL